MTSKIVVNNIESDTGVSTVTFNSNNVQRGDSNLHSTGLNWFGIGCWFNSWSSHRSHHILW